MMSTASSRLLVQHRSTIVRTFQSTARPAVSSVQASTSEGFQCSIHNNQGHDSRRVWQSLLAGGAAVIAAGVHTTMADNKTARCDSSVSIQDLDGEVAPELDLDALPEYTSAQVAQHNGKNPDGSIWMSYGGIVYDVTGFIGNHPGGAEKITEASGNVRSEMQSLVCSFVRVL